MKIVYIHTFMHTQAHIFDTPTNTYTSLHTHTHTCTLTGPMCGPLITIATSNFWEHATRIYWTQKTHNRREHICVLSAQTFPKA